MKVNLRNGKEVSFYEDGVLYVGRPYSEGVVTLTRAQATKIGTALLKWGKKKPNRQKP